MKLDRSAVGLLLLTAKATEAFTVMAPPPPPPAQITIQVPSAVTGQQRRPATIGIPSQKDLLRASIVLSEEAIEEESSSPPSLPALPPSASESNNIQTTDHDKAETKEETIEQAKQAIQEETKELIVELGNKDDEKKEPDSVLPPPPLGEIVTSATEQDSVDKAGAAAEETRETVHEKVEKNSFESESLRAIEEGTKEETMAVEQAEQILEKESKELIVKLEDEEKKESSKVVLPPETPTIPKEEVTPAEEVKTDNAKELHVENSPESLSPPLEDSNIETAMTANEEKSIAEEAELVLKEDKKELIEELENDEKDEVKTEEETKELLAKLEEQKAEDVPAKVQETETKQLIGQLEKDEEKVEKETEQLIEKIEKIEAAAEKAQASLLSEPAAKTPKAAATASATDTNDFLARLRARSKANDDYISLLDYQKKTTPQQLDDVEKEQDFLSQLKARVTANEEFKAIYDEFLHRLKGL